MKKLSSLFLLVCLSYADCISATVWNSSFEADAAGSNPAQWTLENGPSNLVQVSAGTAYRSAKSVQLSSPSTTFASMSRICSNSAPTLQRITWACSTGDTNVDAVYVQVRNSANKIFAGVGLGANGRFKYKTVNGGWVDSDLTYQINQWYRLVLLLNYMDETYSFFHEHNPIVTNQPFAIYQTTNFKPANIVVQGPTMSRPGTSYVDEIKAEFLQNGAALQGLINANASSGRFDMASNCTFHIDHPLLLPSHFTLNGNGSTLRMAPYTQRPILVNSNWSAGNSNLTVCNLVLDGNEFDQRVDPAKNAVSRYNATNVAQLDNQGGYFKRVRNLLVTNVSFQDIPNEALMVLSNTSSAVVSCLFSNCALLNISNDWSQGALYARWTTDSAFVGNRVYDCFEGGILVGSRCVSNLVADNFTYNCAGGEGIFVGQASYTAVVNNEVWLSGYLGDPLNFPTNDTKYWGKGAGIAIQGYGYAHLTVSNHVCSNFVWGAGAEGINSKTAIGSQIYGNEVYLANMELKSGASGAIAFHATTNGAVYSNIVRSNRCNAIGVVSSKSCGISNNIISPGNTANAVSIYNSSGIVSINNN